MSIRPLFAQDDLSRAKHDATPQPGACQQAPGQRVVAASVPEAAGRVGWTIWTLILAFVLAAWMVSRASAQQGNFPYESLPMHPRLEDEAVVRQVEAVTKSYATTGNGDARMANGYFTVYVPAKMTAPDGIKHISKLAEETATLLARAQRSNKPAVAQQLTRFVFDGMKKVAEGNYHPAARINAILLLARLDRQAANPATRTPPIPLRETLPIMIALYEDETNSDGVRAAALQGLHRHVTYGFPQIAADERTKITDLMTSLLGSPAPQGRSVKAHAYLQRFAVDILDTLRDKQDKSLGTQLISISTEPSNPDLIALYSASRLATMGQELQGQVPAPEKVLNSWSKRVLAAFESEIARFEAMERPKPASSQPVKPESFLEKKAPETARRGSRGMMGESEMDQMENEMGMGYSMMEGMGSEMDMNMEMEMGMGMMGMMSGMGTPVEKPQPPEVIASRKKLNYVLQQVHLGVTGYPVAGVPSKAPGGILASVTPEQKKAVEDWLTEMEAVVTVLNDKTLDSEKKYLEGLEEQIEVLKEIAGVDDEAVAAPGELPEELQPVDPLAELAPGGNPPAAAVAAP